jgi:hypothetical protein
VVSVRVRTRSRRWIFKGDKFRCTPSFEWEVKVPCRKILWHVKDLLKSHGDVKTNSHSLCPFCTRFRDVSADRTARVLVAARALW